MSKKDCSHTEVRSKNTEPDIEQIDGEKTRYDVTLQVICEECGEWLELVGELRIRK